MLTDLGALGTARTKAEADYRTIAADKSAKPEAVAAAKAKWDQVVDEWRAAYKLYKALPEEADAWAVGGAVTTAYLAKP